MKKIVVYVEEFFDKRKDGITFQNLQVKYHISKHRAQRILKVGVQKHLFFTPKRTSPQKYYAESRRYSVVEYINNKENALKDTTGTTNTPCNKYSLSICLEYQKANHFWDILISLSFTPLLIHKIVVEMSLDVDSYKLIGGNPWKGNLGILQSERIDNTEVKCVFYKNGKLVLHVICSSRPFKIETEEDLAILYSYFGQVRDRIEYQINDPRGRIVPPITKWILKQCEFNKDIPITDIAQLTLPDIQLSTVFQTFRLYVKNLQGRANYRGESLVQVNQPLAQYLAATISPQAETFCKLERLTEDFRLIQKSINRLEISHTSTPTPTPSTVKTPVTRTGNHSPLETKLTIGKTRVEDLRE